MFPTIHDFTGNNLNTQGYGALSDCLSCSVTEELNGGFTLELQYPLKGIHAEYLATGNIIMVKPNHNQSRQPFRIDQIRKSFANNIVVYANHICYDMAGYYIKGSYTRNSLVDLFDLLNSWTWSADSALAHDFKFYADFISNKTFNLPVRQTLRSWMGGQEGSILDTYGGEWEYDGFNCYLKARRGRDTGIRISYGKNLAEYEKQKNYNDVSHVIAYWQKDDVTVFSDVVPTGMNCPFRTVYYDASKEYDSQPTTAQLNNSANAQIALLNPAAQTITVTPAQIGNDIIGLGDSVLICYESVFQARVIKTTWNALRGAYDKLELGTRKENIAETIKSLVQ